MNLRFATVAPAAEQRVRELAVAAYPHEGCGVLLGRRDGTRMVIVDVTSARNMWTERAADRYDLDPVDFMKADRDARSRGLDVAGIWHSHPDHPAQPSQFDTDHAWVDYVYIICRTTTSGAEDVVRQLDPNLPVYEVMSMEKSLQGANGFFLFKVGASFAGALGALGLLLAVVGIYGVVSYSAGQRRHEIGIRMALGAQRVTVFRLVIGEAVLLLGIGIALGAVLALGVSRLLASLLVGVSAYDPLTFAGVSAMLMAVSLIACYIPAHRAARAEPMAALRGQ